MQPSTKKIRIMVRISSQTSVIMTKIWLMYDEIVINIDKNMINNYKWDSVLDNENLYPREVTDV